MKIGNKIDVNIPVDADFPDEVLVARWDERRLYVHPDIYKETERELGELRHLLAEAIDTIKVFHGSAAWDIYFNNAPEMKRFRAAVETHEFKQANEIIATNTRGPTYRSIDEMAMQSTVDILKARSDG